jgi:FAD dependent oxidoreductase
LNASSPNAWAKASTYSIGDGIVGLSEAMEMTRRFLQLRLVLLEEELQIARHQTGKNSGVIHSGVYYKPGSLKAHMCVSVRFQEQHITRLQRPVTCSYRVHSNRARNRGSGAAKLRLKHAVKFDQPSFLQLKGKRSKSKKYTSGSVVQLCTTPGA